MSTTGWQMSRQQRWFCRVLYAKEGSQQSTYEFWETSEGNWGVMCLGWQVRKGQREGSFVWEKSQKVVLTLQAQNDDILNEGRYSRDQNEGDKLEKRRIKWKGE